MDGAGDTVATFSSRLHSSRIIAAQAVLQLYYTYYSCNIACSEVLMGEKCARRK